MSAECGICGKSFDESFLVELSGTKVCAGCKPQFLQGMREGAEPKKPTMVQVEEPELDLYKIAVNQKRLFFCGIAYVLLFCVGRPGQMSFSSNDPLQGLFFAFITLGGLITVVTFSCIFAHKLMRAQKQNSIYSILGLIIGSLFCVFIPVIILAIMISSANKIFKKLGIPTGGMGANPEAVRMYLERQRKRMNTE